MQVVGFRNTSIKVNRRQDSSDQDFERVGIWSGKLAEWAWYNVNENGSQLMWTDGIVSVVLGRERGPTGMLSDRYEVRLQTDGKPLQTVCVTAHGPSACLVWAGVVMSRAD